MRGIRGAITVEENTAEAIREATRKVVYEMITQNHIATEDIGAAIFSATPPCINSCDCATRDIWAKIGDKLNDVLNSISLADLCHDKAIKEGCIAK